MREYHLRAVSHFQRDAGSVMGRGQPNRSSKERAGRRVGAVDTTPAAARKWPSLFMSAAYALTAYVCMRHAFGPDEREHGKIRRGEINARMGAS